MGRLWTQTPLTNITEGDDAALKTSRQTLYNAFLIPVFNHYFYHYKATSNYKHISVHQLFYQLSTSNDNFLLNLTLQGGLLSRQFRVEYWKRGHLAWSHPYSPHCHYVGHLQDQPHSTKVALSNCNGLVSPRPLSLI